MKKMYDFELVLATPTTEEQDDLLFERFQGRLSAAVANGLPLLYAHLEAPSLEAAIREAVRGARELSLEVHRVEFDPAAVAADAA
jgi:hypothetical protein